MKNKKFNVYTTAAIKAARIGGAVLEGYFNSKLNIGYKGRIDPVTIADKSSQQAIITFLGKKFPSHAFIGEEDGLKQACSDYCWIIDPLDGTVNFIHGVPFFCVSIGLLYKGKIIAGAVYAPCLNELFAAQKGSGAWLNGKKIKVSRESKLVRSLVVTGFPYDIDSGTGRIMKSLASVIVNVQGVRRLGSAALDLAYVSCGRFEAFWEKGLQPWDVAAGAIMVEEAGGKVTDYAGGKGYVFGKTLIATNGRVHAPMKALINI